MIYCTNYISGRNRLKVMRKKFLTLFYDFLTKNQGKNLILSSSRVTNFHYFVMWSKYDLQGSIKLCFCEILAYFKQKNF